MMLAGGGVAMDLATLVVQLTRDEFRSRFTCYFLCADLSVGRATRPQRTEAFAADAGSRNGTFVGDRRLEPKQMSRLAPGERLRFARMPFQLLDASACWDWMVRALDQWG